MAGPNGEPPSPTSDAYFEREATRKNQSRDRAAARDVDRQLQDRGLSRQQRAIVNQQVRTATEDRTLSYEQRREARRTLGAVLQFFDLEFDWDQWRREHGYN